MRKPDSPWWWGSQVLPYLGGLLIVLVGILVAAWLSLCGGCAPLVQVTREYRFDGPVYYPTVTVDKPATLKAQGGGVQ